MLATQLAFEEGIVLTFVYPFGTLALSSVGALGAHYLLAAFERERVRDVFSRFVPEAVVEQVSPGPTATSGSAASHSRARSCSPTSAASRRSRRALPPPR